MAHRLGFGDLFHWKTDEEVIDMMVEPSGIKDQLKEAEIGMYFAEQDYYAYCIHQLPVVTESRTGSAFAFPLAMAVL
ncbi:hypothetical protein SPSYN_02136 [Sporotomaculum syntrophicum]|uniref:Uncharacterized protein n=1 Tax=Sporotomaculum syntrophicum TaxID=182264 RepID=A0A9D2WMX7_9FIRM|nr:hypothetical protein [Sporotomaculum syntrophicum]KAF1084360.1 hypothetical protein SPSYN_02136 [Sporotomaculum syntrophicum]